MDADLCKSTQQWLLAAGVRLPDLAIDPQLLDMGVRHETGEKLPAELRETRQNENKLSGCYAFVDEGSVGGSVRAIYVGKAVRLPNRLQNHWGQGSKWFDQYMDAVDQQRQESVEDLTKGYSGMLTVLVWFSSDRAELEYELIFRLKPLFNVRQW